MGSAWWHAYTEMRDAWAELERRVRQIERRERFQMTQLSDVQASIDALVAEDGVVVSALNDLKARVDAGEQVTSADLDSIVSQLQVERDRMANVVERVDPPQPAQPTDGGGDVPVDPPVDNTPPVDGGGQDVPPADTPPVDTAPDAPADSPPLDAGPTNV